MKTIRETTRIVLPEGYSEYVLDADRDVELHLEGSAKSDVYLRIERAGNVTISADIHTGAHVSFLVWNASENPVTFQEDYTVERDAMLRIAYGEVNAAAMHRKGSVHLIEEGAGALVSSASLVSDEKDFELYVINEAPHTEGILQNYAVVLEGGKFRMDATGKIVKGAHGAQSHQTSRALCFDEKQNSTILPKLLIDENDVQASHATTLGRVDEEQMYYMQARGLTVRQCTSLISAGYLLPVTQFIEDETLKATLREELEKKMEEL
ncbi:MAG: SufD family Fe-S cluster assembly protein [Solobacterium sp.]|nr:SufD family Fe-S cluster assembly protein [Solobacterium sp.]